jgi:uncharacterized protein (TIGR02246 family)
MRREIMRTFIALTIILLFAAMPVMAQSAADEAAIREVVKQINVAFNKSDAKAMASYIVEDFENWPGTRKGRKQVSENWASAEGQYKQLDEIGIIFVTPDVAIFKEHGEETGFLDSDGKPLPTEKVLESWVAVKKNGKWLLAAIFTRAIED